MKYIFLFLLVVACGKDPLSSKKQPAVNKVISDQEKMIQISCGHFQWCMDECERVDSECLAKKIEIPESELCSVNYESSEHDFSHCPWKKEVRQ